MIPLLLLPFLCLFFYIYKSSFGKEEPVVQNENALQEHVAEVSEDVKKKTLGDKLDAYKNQFKEGDGYTAVGVIGEENVKSRPMPDLYNQREKRMLDSIDQAIKRKYGAGTNNGTSPYRAAIPTTNQYFPKRATDNSSKELAEAISKLSQPAPVVTRPNGRPQEDPMTAFREQMKLIDSMGKANDPTFRAEQAREKAMELAEKELRSHKKLPVQKTTSATVLFNTIFKERGDSFIRAIVDQDIVGYAGSRLRIRLLDDMSAGRFLIKKGTYLYAQVTGFAGQRVNLSISTIFQEKHILPVRLDIYDNDGLPGLYVPASAFREFSKGLGSDASQGMTIQQQAENNNQLVMSMVQKMFQSTTTAVGKLIRSNKAKLKYNTQVYLIDPEELKNIQSKY